MTIVPNKCLFKQAGCASRHDGKRHLSRYRVNLHNIASTRRTNPSAASASPCAKYPHATATRNAASDSFALPAAVKYLLA